MNLRRTLSNHQLYYLQQIAKGHIIVVDTRLYEEYYDAFYDGKTYPGVHVTTPPNGKPRGGRHILCGGHMYSSIVEMKQRGILVDHEGRFVPCKEAQRQFGKPPPLVIPKRKLKMSRTRAARAQM